MVRYGSIFLLIVFAGPVFAVENMSFTGMLIEPPPCTIKDGDEIEVNFGDRVGVSKVDGVNYLRPVTYTISCDPSVEAWNMTLEVVGSAADYDAAAIKPIWTTWRSACCKTMNGLFSISRSPSNVAPTLTAVPVKRPGATLKSGKFVATATLLAVYQ